MRVVASANKIDFRFCFHSHLRPCKDCATSNEYANKGDSKKRAKGCRDRFPVVVICPIQGQPMPCYSVGSLIATKVYGMSYLMENERRILSKVVKAALSEGWTVSVHDGEAWALKKSDGYRTIMSACGTTDMDTLRFRDSNNTVVGHVTFVWGNGEDCLSDHSEALVDFVDSLEVI